VGLGRGRLVPLASTKVHLVGRGPSWERGAKSRLERSGAGEVDRLRRCSARALGLVHPLPANESASIAGVGSGFESAFKGLERRVAVEEYPGRVAAHRALPGLVDYFSTHARNVDLEHRAVRVRSEVNRRGRWPARCVSPGTPPGGPSPQKRGTTLSLVGAACSHPDPAARGRRSPLGAVAMQRAGHRPQRTRRANEARLDPSILFAYPEYKRTALARPRHSPWWTPNERAADRRAELPEEGKVPPLTTASSPPLPITSGGTAVSPAQRSPRRKRRGTQARPKANCGDSAVGPVARRLDQRLTPHGRLRWP